MCCCLCFYTVPLEIMLYKQHLHPSLRVLRLCAYSRNIRDISEWLLWKLWKSGGVKDHKYLNCEAVIVTWFMTREAGITRSTSANPLRFARVPLWHKFRHQMCDRLCACLFFVYLHYNAPTMHAPQTLDFKEVEQEWLLTCPCLQQSIHGAFLNKSNVGSFMWNTPSTWISLLESQSRPKYPENVNSSKTVNFYSVVPMLCIFDSLNKLYAEH